MTATKTRSILVPVHTLSHSGVAPETVRHMRITLPAEPGHVDTPPAMHPRPTERSLYAMHTLFGGSGPRVVPAGATAQKSGGCE